MTTKALSWAGARRLSACFNLPDAASQIILNTSHIVDTLRRRNQFASLSSYNRPMQALRKRPLTIREILDWATRHKETTGKWPTTNSGEIPGSFGETWAAVDAALREGMRDLPTGSSIARLVAEKC